MCQGGCGRPREVQLACGLLITNGTQTDMQSNLFWRKLSKENGYVTPESIRRSWINRLLGSCATWYHLRTLLTVARLWRQIKTGGRTRAKWADRQCRILEIIESTGARVHIDGIEHLKDANPPYIVVANHMSSVETLLLPLMILAYGDTTMVVKESLIRYPALGSILTSIRAIPISRHNPREDFKRVMNHGCQLLKDDWSIVVFPQATRSIEFKPATFSSIGVKLARRAKVAVIPCALKTDFQQPGRLIKDLGRIVPENDLYFRFGPAIAPGTPPRDAHGTVVQFIQDCLAEWKR